VCDVEPVSCASPEPPATPGELDLLRAHRPWLQYSQDPFRICSATTIVDTPGNALHRPDGPPLHAGAGLSLDALSPEASAGAYLEAPGVSELVPPALQDDPGYAPRVYGRVVGDSGGGSWLQYWFWLNYNQKRLLGFGAHQGDWEMIQIHVNQGGRPTRVTFAQHDHGDARRWGRRMEIDDSDGSERLVVFVAPFSHASYARPGTKFYAGGTDSPDRLGPHLLPEVEPFGAWASWPGRWGATRDRTAKSPEGPACQGAKWTNPARFHTLSLGLKPWQKALKLLWVVGHLTYPRRPRIEARIEGGVVRAEVARGFFRRGRHLYVTAHALEDRRVVGGPKVVPNVHSTHRFEIDLREPVERCLVYATAYNVWRQTSDPGRCEAVRAAMTPPA